MSHPSERRCHGRHRRGYRVWNGRKARGASYADERIRGANVGNLRILAPGILPVCQSLHVGRGTNDVRATGVVRTLWQGGRVKSVAEEEVVVLWIEIDLTLTQKDAFGNPIDHSITEGN